MVVSSCPPLPLQGDRTPTSRVKAEYPNHWTIEELVQYKLGCTAVIKLSSLSVRSKIRPVARYDITAPTGDT